MVLCINKNCSAQDVLPEESAYKFIERCFAIDPLQTLSCVTTALGPNGPNWNLFRIHVKE